MAGKAGGRVGRTAKHCGQQQPAPMRTIKPASKRKVKELQGNWNRGAFGPVTERQPDTDQFFGGISVALWMVDGSNPADFGDPRYMDRAIDLILREAPTQQYRPGGCGSIRSTNIPRNPRALTAPRNRRTPADSGPVCTIKHRYETLPVPHPASNHDSMPRGLGCQRNRRSFRFTLTRRANTRNTDDEITD